MFIDSHAHLDVPQYDADRADVIARAQESGVEIILEILGSDVARGSLDAGMKIVEEHPFIYGAVGVHPHEASIYDDVIEQKLTAIAQNEKIIGWGEIGLDYYYDNSPRETQREVFRRQLELARERRLPVIIHTRDAEDDTIAILREGASEIGGIIHCFTGTQKLADAAVALGFHISFSGVLTFNKAEELREVAKSIPLNKLLIETDCPYLAPMPHRGKRNEPAFVLETAAKLAEVKGLSLEEIARITSENFINLFKLKR